MQKCFLKYYSTLKVSEKMSKLQWILNAIAYLSLEMELALLQQLRCILKSQEHKFELMFVK